MTIFMQNHQVYLTPISPIHIGCGEDFEPTNYTIDNNVLYHFDPSMLPLTKEKREDLTNRSNRTDLLSIQRFFLENKELACQYASYFADVSMGVSTVWKQRIGKVANNEKEGNAVINKLAIERNSYLPYQHAPYIPGSSFKGALATAILNKAHHEEGSPKVSAKAHKSLVKKYVGEFSDSLLRYVKFSDFVPQSLANSHIYYALNFKKVPTHNGSVGKGVPLRRECISHGQYRVFISQLSLILGLDKKTQHIEEYLSTINTFYKAVLAQELKVLLERNLVEKKWVNAFIQLVDTMLKNKRCALIRLGKNGADSKVYQDNVAQIKIMKGKGEKPDYKPQATTLWLAAENEKQTSNLLPFGWAIIEVDPQEDNLALKQWCEQQPKSHFDREEILQKRKELEAERQRQQAEQKAKREAEIQAELAKQEMLNSLSDNQRSVMDFVEQVNATRELQADTTGSALLKSLTQLVESAVLSWNKSEKDFLLEHITTGLIKTKVKFNKKDGEKNLKKLLNKLTVTS
ncbi:type III-A CRISPR-associated RAMP protein Csm5 [Pasteurella sp. PK-2025]|uniref:type III-A CRISPR-associated RAMP protein Csm5 n=1 Tax=Pasteurella sp. PK-2025 TaxID=3413133 RepID=UPI003C741F8E